MKREKIAGPAVTAFTVDVAALHADRLREYYYKDISLNDALAKYKVLAKHELNRNRTL